MQYNLVFSTDNNYLPYLFVLCQSIIDHLEQRDSNSQDALVFNVMVDESVDIASVTAKANSFVARNQSSGVSISFKWLEVSASNFCQLTSMKKDGKTSFSTYYRLIIDRLLPTDVNYAAYLDIDMLVLTDIRKLFEQNDISDKVLGAVIDPGTSNKDPKLAYEPFTFIYHKDNPSKQLQISRESYFNAGLLLINLKEWRKHNIGEDCLNLAPKVNLQFHDQDLLNYFCQGKVKLLQPSWNFQHTMFHVLYNPETQKYDICSIFNQDKHWFSTTPNAAEFEQFALTPYIVHFSDHKPWTSYALGNSVSSTMVPIIPRLKAYCQEWEKVSLKITEFPLLRAKVLNSDAVDFTMMELIKLNNKRRKDRKQLISLIGLSLILNIITLTCLILD